MPDLVKLLGKNWATDFIAQRQKATRIQLNKERPVLQQLNWTDEQLACYQERILGIERRFNRR